MYSFQTRSQWAHWFDTKTLPGPMNAFFLRPRFWRDEHRICSVVFMEGRSCICDWSKNFSSTPSKTDTKTISISIHQISEQQFSRLLIGSLNSEYPWIFTVLGRNSKWLLVSRQFQKITFSVKLSSCTSKYQERDKIWLVGVYRSIEKNFLAEFATKS